MDIKDKRLPRNVGVPRSKLRPGKVYVVAETAGVCSFHMPLAGSMSLVNLYTGVTWEPDHSILFVEVDAELIILTLKSREFMG